VPRRRQAVRGEVGGGLLEFAHGQVHYLWINHRVVRSDADHRGGLEGAGSLVVSVQNVLLLPPVERVAALLAQLRHKVILRGAGRGHDHAVQPARPADALDDADQHGLAADVGKHLSRQARGAHSGLNDGEDAVRFVHIPASFGPTLLSWPRPARVKASS
jgi:hypothetical protein